MKNPNTVIVCTAGIGFIVFIAGISLGWFGFPAIIVKAIKQVSTVSMFHRAFFNSITDIHQHMHFFTFRTVLVQNVNFNVKIHKNI